MKTERHVRQKDLRLDIKEFIDHKIRELCEMKSLSMEVNQFDADFNLYESGLLDSFDLYQFLLSIEEGLDIEIDISEKDPEEFTNYDKLIDLLLEAKLKTL